MEIDFQALIDNLLAESEDSLGLMEESLLLLETRPGDKEALGAVFRVVHTLKGDAGLVGFAATAEFAHRLEDLLDLVREEQTRVTGTLVTLLLQSVDALRDLLREASTGQDELLPAHVDLLVKLGEAASTGEGPSELSTSTDGGFGGDRRPASLRVGTLRVDVEKLNQLLTLTGEIAVARGRLTQLLEDPDALKGEILEEHREADRLYLDLQELVMKLRMVPVGSTFRHYARTVRDLAMDHGKQAKLVLEGGDVEVDNSVLQLLRDPLTHLVRNAVDHGIEPPEERKSKGKDPTGKIRLRAHHVAGSIVIELEDDGAGLDRSQILDRARALGMLADGEHPSERELSSFLFEPGFSTSATVSELSGRGVGLDVVRRNIETLRGSVEVRSRPDEGTQMTICLPLTLAIIEGLEVRIEDQTFIVPLDSVVEALDLPEEASADPAARGVVTIRGHTLPYVRLRELFAVDCPAAARENIVVVELGGAEAGLVVDEVFDKKQVVIKPLAKVFERLRGISGSAILGNGRVSLILDVPGLLRGEMQRETTAAVAAGT